MAATVVGLTLAAVVVHLRSRGEGAITECDRALAAGDAVAAIAWARDAAMAVAPWSPYPEQGYVRLVGIADRAEERGDFQQASVAWRAVEVAVRATRSESQEAERLVAADSALVRLAAKTCEGDQSRPPAVCAAAARSALADSRLPSAARLEWLGTGGVGFLVFGAVAAQASRRRVRLLSLGVAAAGAAMAAAALLVR